MEVKFINPQVSNHDLQDPSTTNRIVQKHFFSARKLNLLQVFSSVSKVLWASVYVGEGVICCIYSSIRCLVEIFPQIKINFKM